jgi:hypothetical protein
MAEHQAPPMHLPQAELTPASLAAAAARPGPRRPAGHGRKRAALARPHAAARVADEIERLATAQTPRMKHAIRHIHFVGIGGAGMSGIAEILHNLGYTSRARDQPTAPPRAGWPIWACVSSSATMPRTSPAPRPWSPAPPCADNPEVHRRARARIPVVPRAVMLAELMRLQAGHRHRRHARQDDDHLAGHQRAGRGRCGPDLRDRRQAERRRPTPASGRATTSWSRPTRATPPSCT